MRDVLLKQIGGRMFCKEQTHGVFLEGACKRACDVLLESMLGRTCDVWEGYKCNPTNSG